MQTAQTQPVVLMLGPQSTHWDAARRALGGANCEIRWAPDLASAKAALRRARVAVALVDGDSERSWTRLIATRTAPNVIVLSRVADEGRWLDVLARGGYDLLANPCREDELRAAVHRAMGGWLRRQ